MRAKKAEAARLTRTLPEDHFHAISVYRCGLLTVFVPDVQDRALAIADALAHSNIDEENQSVPLKHLAGVALLPVLENNLLMLMALHQVVDAQSGSVAP